MQIEIDINVIKIPVRCPKLVHKMLRQVALRVMQLKMFPEISAVYVFEIVLH